MMQLMKSPFDIDNLFGQFFETGPETIRTQKESIYIDLPLAGVDPANVQVERRGTSVRANWVDTLGAKQTRAWDIRDRSAGVTARLVHGLLTIEIASAPVPDKGSWTNVEIKKP